MDTEKLNELVNEYVESRMFEDGNYLSIDGYGDLLNEEISLDDICDYGDTISVKICHGEFSSINEDYFTKHADDRDGKQFSNFDEAMDYLEAQDEKHGHYAPKVTTHERGDLSWARR